MPKKLNLGHLALVTILSLVLAFTIKHYYHSKWWEFSGFVISVVAVYLAAVEHIINWPVNIVCSLIYVWVFYDSRLLADMSLNIFFVMLGIQGWWQWARGGEGNSAMPITLVRPTWWLAILLVWAVGTGIYYPIVNHFGGASPLIDSSLTVASIIAQIMLNIKKLENWIIWVVVDAIYIWLYIQRNLQATAVLYLLYVFLAILGFVGWLRTVRSATETSLVVAAK